MKLENFAQLMKYSARNDLVCSEYSWGKNRHFISLCFLPFLINIALLIAQEQK